MSLSDSRVDAHGNPLAFDINSRTDFESIAAWRCEVCARYRATKVENPTMLIVAEPGPIEELQITPNQPFFRRRMIVCKRCYEEMHQ